MAENIYLDCEDNLSRAVEKIRSSLDDKLYVIIPPDSILWQSRLNFELISDNAQTLGKKIIIVTPSEAGEFMVKSAGLQVARSLEEAHFKNQEEKPDEEKPPEKAEASRTDNFGFLYNQDIAEVLKDQKGNQAEKEEIATPPAPFKIEKLQVEEKPLKLEKPAIGRKRPKIYQKFSFWLIMFFVFLILGTTGFMLYYLPKAQVQLYVQGESLEQRLEVVAKSSILAVSTTDKTIPAIPLKVEEKGQKTAKATGEKTVGEKAKGNITLQNWTENAKTFPAGAILTVIQGENGAGLTFTLDSEAAIPARTFNVIPEGYEVKFGKVTAVVTATQVGADYNLKSAITLSIGEEDLADFKVVTNAALTGGTSREVTIVSEADRTRLLADLSGELYAKGKNDLLSQVIGDQKYSEEGIQHKIVSQTFNQEARSEAQDLSLSLTTETSMMVFSESQVKTLVLYYLNQNVPEGFKLKEENMNLTLESIDPQTDGLKIEALGAGSILPEIDTEQIKNKLIGKRPWEAEEILEGEAKIVGYKIELWPTLPRFLQSLPNFLERLSIEVSEKNENTGD